MAPRRRITSKVRQQIIEHYERGDVSGSQTAEKFGVGTSTVLNILKQSEASVLKQGQ